MSRLVWRKTSDYSIAAGEKISDPVFKGKIIDRFAICKAKSEGRWLYTLFDGRDIIKHSECPDELRSIAHNLAFPPPPMRVIERAKVDISKMKFKGSKQPGLFL